MTEENPKSRFAILRERIGGNKTTVTLDNRPTNRLVVAVIGLLIIIAVLVIWFAVGLSGKSGESKQFTVHDNESRKAIAHGLEDQGIIRSWSRFVIISYWQRAEIQPGVYTLNPSDSAFNVLAALTSGEFNQQIITIPEGWRREQIADYLSTKGVDKQQFLALSADKEGQLFPDTYYILKHPLASDIINQMLENYQTKTKDLNLTPTQLIIASIVEREVKSDDQRALVSGIYLHRLQIGMKLEADPTVQYGRDTNLAAAGTPPSKWWGPITQADYKNVISAFNAYLNDGLPPSPICNPGIKSIEAAINPTATDAVYFINPPDGSIVIAKTLDEQTANIAKYLR